MNRWKIIAAALLAALLIVGSGPAAAFGIGRLGGGNFGHLGGVAAARIAAFTNSILVANRNQISTVTAVVPDLHTSRRSHYASPQGAISNLKFVDCGFYIDASFAIANAPASYTIKRYLEYPAGVFTQVTWSAATSVSISGAHVVSDPVAVTIPAGAKFWERTVHISGANRTIPMIELPDFSATIGADDTYALSDMGNSGTPSGSATNFLGSVAIIGTVAKGNARAFVVAGDSITWGLGDVTSVGMKGASGWFARGLDPLFPWMKVARSSVRTEHVLAYGAPVTNLLASVGFTDFVTALGTNDLWQGINHAATVISNQQAIAASWASGKRFYMPTLPPWTSSTDTWVTTVNQTERVDGFWSELDALNGLIRAHPAGVTNHVEAADATMSARDSGIWQAPPALTTDGLHPSSAGAALASDAVASGVGASTPFSVAYTDHAEDNTAQTTETFAGRAFNIGLAESSRVAVATITGRFVSAATITSVTIGGVAATKVVEANQTPGIITSMWQAAVPTGQTATISAVFSIASVRAGVVVHRVNASNGVVPSGAAISFEVDTVTPLTGNAAITVPANGGTVFAAGYSQGGASAVSSAATNYIQAASAYNVGGQFLWQSAGTDMTAGARSYTVSYGSVSSSLAALTLAAAYGP